MMIYGLPTLPKTAIVLLVSLLIGFTGIAQSRSVYNMFLQQPVPANGVRVDFNSPVLRWPYQKGKQVTYQVRLSQDDAFASTTTITATDLKGAIFNPHQKLSTGKWFWQYRVTGKSWSAVQYFLVDDKALPMISPSPATLLANIPTAHPRILVDEPAANLYLLSNKPAAKAIIAEADKALLEKIPIKADVKPTADGANDQQNEKIMADAIVSFGNRVNHLVQPLCEAYLLTRHQKYIPKAVDIAMEIARWDAEGVSGSRDFTDGICMYDMALVFDTFYDQLTNEQKDLLIKAITTRASKFYKSWVNNIESKVLSGHVWQLLLNEFFKTSIALYGHQPEAATWLSFAYELFVARSPVLGGLDGGWAEGASYFTMNMEMLTYIPQKIKQYTGFDFIQQHPWYYNNANWMIYQFPVGSSADGFGDNTEELFEPPASYAAYADVMARLTQNPRYAWYADKLQQSRKIDLSAEPILRWYRLTQSDALPLPQAKDTIHLPMAQLNKEVGVASLHTNPANAKTDVMVAMRSSPFGAYGHILADQNTFNILYGGKRLFYRTGYKVAMNDPHRLGWSKHTKGQNGILINGEGQPYTVEPYGNFSRFLQGDQLAYIKGDASNAYQSVESKEDYGVNKFYRHIVLLKPGIIVLYDELESAADANWSWLIHSLKDMKLNAASNTFTSTIDNATGVGKLWSSQPFTWQLTDQFDVPAVVFRNYKGMKTKKYDDQWHLKATNNTKSSKVRFLSVIQVSADGKVLPFKEMPASPGITKLTIGDWQIEASLSYDVAPQLIINSSKRNTAFAGYGKEINLKGQSYKPSTPGNSMLVEWVNGKMKFSEMADEGVRPIR